MVRALRPRPRTARGRRRGAALEEAVLRAAIDELLAVGYARLTMDRVAERAGTNKNAIYRRWPSRAMWCRGWWWSRLRGWLAGSRWRPGEC